MREATRIYGLSDGQAFSYAVYVPIQSDSFLRYVVFNLQMFLRKGNSCLCDHRIDPTDQNFNVPYRNYETSKSWRLETQLTL